MAMANEKGTKKRRVLRLERGMSAIELFIMASVSALILLVAFQASRTFVEFVNNSTAAAKIGSSIDGQDSMEEILISGKYPGAFFAVRDVAALGTFSFPGVTDQPYAVSKTKYVVIVESALAPETGTAAIASRDEFTDVFNTVYGDDSLSRGRDAIYVGYPSDAKADLKGFRKIGTFEIGDAPVSPKVRYDLFKIMGR